MSYVIWLEVPDTMRVRSGPVTITWGDGEVVTAGVLGAQFTSPAELAKEQEEHTEFRNALEAIADDSRPWHTCDHADVARAALGTAVPLKGAVEDPAPADPLEERP